MAKKNDASVTEEFMCVKEVTCACCGTVYQFPHKTTVTGTGPIRIEARKDAFRKAPAELAGETGRRRCPTCGVLPTCMEASTNAFGYGCMLWFSGIVLAIALVIGVLLELRAISFVPLYVMSWTSFAILLLPVLINILLVRRNANWNLERKRERSKTEPVSIISSSSNVAIPDSLPRSTTVVQSVAIVLSLVGLCILPAAEILRMASGWTINASSFPPVAGPGDEVTVYWPKSLDCLKGYWKGSATVEFADTEGKVPPAALPATCRTEEWGQFVGGKGTTNRDTVIWTKVQLPDDPGLKGKTVKLISKIDVVYPHSTGIFGFENREEQFAHEFQLRLSAPKAAATYHDIWWAGMAIGGVLIVASTFMLRRGQLSLLKSCPYPRTMNVTRVDDVEVVSLDDSIDDDDAVAVDE